MCIYLNFLLFAGNKSSWTAAWCWSASNVKLMPHLIWDLQCLAGWGDVEIVIVHIVMPFCFLTNCHKLVPFCGQRKK